MLVRLAPGMSQKTLGKGCVGYGKEGRIGTAEASRICHEKDRHNILYGSVKYRGGLSDCITICGIYTSRQMVSERWQNAGRKY